MSDAPNTYMMELSKPIEANGEEVRTLTLRDPESGHLEGIEVQLGRGGVKIDMGSLVKIIAAMADIPPSAAKKIPMRDLFKHFVGILAFLGVETQTTGGS